jgi:hypothetical protein
MDNLDALLENFGEWVRTADGNNVRKQELCALIIDEVLDEYDPLTDLADKIRADKRKTFSKAKLLELIEELRG